MSPQAVTTDDVLSWEDLGSQPAGRAFRRSLCELLSRPAGFYRKMALSGGLHEPVAFFAICLGAVVLLAFPAALAYFFLVRPDPGRMPYELYARYVLVTQGTGLAVVLLPLVLAAGAGAVVALGTAFHLGARLFGARNWEGSVSIYLYASAGALVPLGAALALLLLVSLAGCVVGDGARATLVPIARWTSLIGFGAALLGGAGLLLSLTAFGCAAAFGLDPILGTAAGLSGVIAAAAVAAGLWYGLGWLGAWGLLALAGLAVAATRRGGT